MFQLEYNQVSLHIALEMVDGNIVNETPNAKVTLGQFYFLKNGSFWFKLATLQRCTVH